MCTGYWCSLVNSSSRGGFGRPSVRLDDLLGELLAVEKLLWKLRHNRGRWPRKWCTGMIRHYEKREASLRADISRRKRTRTKLKP